MDITLIVLLYIQYFSNTYASEAFMSAAYEDFINNEVNFFWLQAHVCVSWSSCILPDINLKLLSRCVWTCVWTCGVSFFFESPTLRYGCPCICLKLRWSLPVPFLNWSCLQLDLKTWIKVWLRPMETGDVWGIQWISKGYNQLCSWIFVNICTLYIKTVYNRIKTYWTCRSKYKWDVMVFYL